MKCGCLVILLKQQLEDGKKRLTTMRPRLFHSISVCGRMPALSDNEADTTDQFFSLEQIFFCFLQHDVVELESDSVPMNDFVGQVLPHQGDLSIASCRFKKEISFSITIWRWDDVVETR